jgi:CubicO group peptidase (beta-lactamase class C family)
VGEIVPSATILNDPTAIQNFRTEEMDFRNIKIKGLSNRCIDHNEFIETTHTDALVILKSGVIIEEKYFSGMTPSSQHILMSVSKSLLGLLIGILVDQNLFKPGHLATDILPELERTAYRGVSIRQLLDMRTGVVFEEDYLATQGKIIEYREATNWNPVAKNEPESDLRSFYNLLTESDGPHGGKFHYVSPNTDLLGWLIEKASGSRYADLMEELIWKPMGATYPASITVDRLGAPRVAGGMSSTARDLAIIGQLIINNGVYNERQIIPSDWITDIKCNGSKQAWNKGDFAQYYPSMDMSYRSKWYAERIGKDAKIIFGLGVHGQHLFVDIEKELVIAKFSSQPLPLDKEMIQLTTRWVNALRDIF